VDQPLRIVVVEDEVLLQMQLGMYLKEAGHCIVDTAVSQGEVRRKAEGWDAELALVDVHLADGPTGIEVGRLLAERGVAVVFMTGNVHRIPADFSGAIGVIGKPYTQDGVAAALEYLMAGVRHPPPSMPAPPSLTLSGQYARDWSR
jgi:DNA-binding response OmpR family regulator